jgi:YfiR/HmsC-like
MVGGRQGLRVVVAVVALVGATRLVRADDPSVPLQLQVDLSAKMLEYVQEPPVMSFDRVRIGIVVKPGSPESTRAGAELKVAFDRVGTIGGRAHEQSIVDWSGAAPLIEHARRGALIVLYFTPGLDAEVQVVARSLDGQRLMTIAAVDSYVQDGVILGFELVSGHPKMILNLAQSKRQGVVLRAAVLKLVRILK